MRHIVDDPLGSLRTNTRGTEHVLDACARHRRRVLIASTSEIYGKSPSLPWHEDDDRVLGRPTCRAGRMRQRKRSTSTSRSHTPPRACRSRSCGTSTPTVPDSILGATDRWLPGSSARRSPESPSPCTATAPRPAASPMSLTRCGARCSRRGRTGRLGRCVQHRIRRRDHARRPRPDDHRTDGVDVDDPARELRESEFGGRFEDPVAQTAPTSRERAPSSGGSQRCRWQTACVARWSGGAPPMDDANG